MFSLKKLFPGFDRGAFGARLGRKEYRAEFARSLSQIYRDNRRVVHLSSMIATILSVALILISFLNPAFGNYRIAYVFLLCVSLATFLLVASPLIRREKNIMWLLYLFVGCAYVFAIALGTYFAPKATAATYMVFLVVIPLLVIDLPVRLGAFNFASFAVFVVAAILFDDPEILVEDIITTAVFAVLSITVGLYSLANKLDRYFLENKIRDTSETDVLTGVKNRLAFEKAAAEMGDSPLFDTYFVYVDANGLHDLNDSRGHDVGDGMLRNIATALTKVLAVDVYRIGGDEFVFFGDDMDEDILEERIDALNGEIERSGFTASIGYAYGGNRPFATLMHDAEEKMYQVKENFYLSIHGTRHSRRSHLPIHSDWDDD